MYSVKTELPLDRWERSRLNRLKPRDKSARAQVMTRTHAIGPGRASPAEANFRAMINKMATEEIKQTGKTVKAALTINLYKSRDEAWMDKLKKRPSWRQSQGGREIRQRPTPLSDKIK